MSKNIFRLIVFAALMLYYGNVVAQVTIGSDQDPNDNALLDLKEDALGSSTKGLLLPRVALTATNSPLPMSVHVAGMIVFNTATASDVTPGFYYNDGTKWVRAANAIMESKWTNDPANKVVKLTNLSDGATARNEPQNIFITDDGKVGLGEQNPTTKLEINNGSTTGALRIVDGTEGEGKILTSNAQGVATWRNPASHYIQQVATGITSDLPITTSGITIPGLNGFTAPMKGKYMIIFHSFFNTTTEGLKSYYLTILKNNSVAISNDETYSYVTANGWFNTHYSTIIDINVGDVITYRFKTPPFDNNLTVPASSTGLASRNKMEVYYLGE